MTTDTLVEGIHFFAGCDPESLGHKSLAVSLSDLAAIGAEPAWVTLALTLPSADEAWLTGFSRGFLNLAERFRVELVGGDTTRGPLSVTVQAVGYVDEGRGLRRSSAQPGDGIYLTGELGLAGLGLKIRLGEIDICAPEALRRLERPEPRVQDGLFLANLARACIDVSDGLGADLGHILEASGVGASLDWSLLPLPECVVSYIKAGGDWRMPLVAGDDYELCFTVAAKDEAEFVREISGSGSMFTRIGQIDDRPGLRLRKDGRGMELPATGFQHFSSDT